MTMAQAPRRQRCAIYTRKSSEEGLDMEFNSLDAQRESCEAYVASQRSEGFAAIRERYDDGGHSGGTLERPALQRLLADVEAASLWFQDVLGLTSGHGGPDYEMLMHGDTLVAQLHRWEADEHPEIGDPDDPSRGNGVLLWFATDDMAAMLGRLEQHRPTVDEALGENGAGAVTVDREVARAYDWQAERAEPPLAVTTASRNDDA